MREIKFRAWDGSSMEYDIAVGRHTKSTCDYNSCVVLDDGAVWLYEEPPVAVMQHTGLKDKNDVEIYEGDVVSDGMVNWVVEYCSYRHTWTVKLGKRVEMLAALNPEDMEVIGNIYENEDLLKD